MSERPNSSSRERSSPRLATRGPSTPMLAGWICAWSAVLVLAIWLSQLSGIWVVAAAVGSLGWTTFVALARDRSAAALAVALWLCVGAAAGFQLRLDRIAGEWADLQPRLEEPLADELATALDDLVSKGEEAAAGVAQAADAYRTGGNRTELFDRLARLRTDNDLSAVALFDSLGSPIGWAGEHRGSVPTDARFGLRSYLYEEGPLFSYLYFIRPLQGGMTATAAILLEASLAPGDEATPFAERFETMHGARPRFWTPERARPESLWDWATVQGPIFSVSFSSLTQQDWWLRSAEQARQTSAILLGVALLIAAVVWYGTGGLPPALPVALATATLLLAPLDRLFAAESLFSPLQFVLPLAIDVTLGNLLILLIGVAVGALIWSSGSPPKMQFSGVAGTLAAAFLIPGAVLLIGTSANDGFIAAHAAGGFALQSALALSIGIPAFFILRHSRTPRWVGRHRRPALLAGLVLPALLGVAVALQWSPESPIPYHLAALWAIPIVLLWAGIRHEATPAVRSWLLAGWVGSTCALAYLWPLHQQAELDSAERELQLLGVQADPFLDFLLRQFNDRVSLLSDEGEGGVNLLYHTWVESGLADEGYEAALKLWEGDTVIAELNLSDVDPLPPVSGDAIPTDQEGPTIVHYGGVDGLHYLLASTLPDSTRVTVSVPPRRGLRGATTLAQFLRPYGESDSRAASESLVLMPPLNEAPAAAARDQPVRWIRVPEGWRSETLVEMPEGRMHAHLLLTTAPIPLLIARAALVTAAILALFGGVWLAARWLCYGPQRRGVRRLRWLRSFRGRLSLALFAFFLLPTIVFGIVSYRAVAREVIRSATALAQQALDQAAGSGSAASTPTLGGTPGSDLLVYSNGLLTAATASEVIALGLFHTWLPPEVNLRFAAGEELQAVEERQLGESTYLVSYRRLNEATVLAAPVALASDEIRIRQLEFRDVTLFMVLLGLGLSVVLALLVSRTLARPLDELSLAAGTVGAGNLSTRLSESRSDEFGRVYQAFNQMVTRLDFTRAALVRETRKTETIVAEAATGVLAIDATGKVELINPRAAEILGGEVEVGSNLAQSEGSPLLVRAVVDLMNSPAPEPRSEVELDGRTVRLNLRRLTGADARGGVVIALEDITAEIRTARVLAWGEMARQVAHEIKNPLTPIKLAVQHLRRAFLDGRADFDEILERNVESILREIDRLGEIARAFSRFGTPAAVASPPQPVDLATTTREVLALYRGSTEGVVYHAELPPDLPRAIARAGELKEVLLNLLENARESVGEAGSITVAAYPADRPGWVCVAVTDDGVGIPEAQLPIIFEPHFSTRSSGTGLGLAIVRRMVESWGGEIRVQSTVGQGARFEIVMMSETAAQYPGDGDHPSNPHTAPGD